MRLALALTLAATLSAHRLDEYLQATLISIESDQIELEITLTPGVAIAPVVLAMIDTDSDGLISDAEQQAYVHKVLESMTLESDDEKLAVSVVESNFPSVDRIREGLGAIHVRARAPISYTWQSNRKLSFTNRHAPAIAAYLVNCLAPQTVGLTIQQQTRDYLQSAIQVTYSAPHRALSLWWLAAAVALLALSTRRIRSAIQFR